MNIYKYKMKSPVGVIQLFANDQSLIGLFMEKEKVGKLHKTLKSAIQKKTAVLAKAEKEIQQYFSGELKKFSIPLEFFGTDFQKQVWKQLIKIPKGQLQTYAQHAGKISKPRAVRAVGTAIGSNPISIIVPCHRVVGATGSLTGYAGGLKAKELLLKLEGHRVIDGLIQEN